MEKYLINNPILATSLPERVGSQIRDQSKACSLVKQLQAISSSVSCPLSFLNLILTCEWEVGSVYTSSIYPIAFYYRLSRTRWWGLVLFPFGTVLCFTVEPVTSHPQLWMLCFLSKTGSIRKEKEMTPWPPACPLQPDLFKTHSLQTNPAPVSGGPSSPPALRLMHLTPAQESCSFSPFHSPGNLLFSTSKRRLVCTSCFKQQTKFPVSTSLKNCLPRTSWNNCSNHSTNEERS